ncbi:sigma-54 interaction domain-containing protein [Thermosediminibacter litoriperuensis]|uniref:PAS domain S-box-containing protein n=1 Tax=Thermosediminibacter litoriperuensis TaxID=291989 RepID=A0A5S5AWR1_9FIRM|nr:sigma 54-interacting transcriptional regulator [Thermosediminibacter litoriperuensis]TYP57791.1 PAS domain S-box-containing protein [Thermosediminibacter litoriperuensis]
MIDANAGSVHATFDIPLQSILEHINEGICVIDRSRRVIYWNRRSEKLYGIKKEQILGKDIEQFFPNALALEVLKTGRPVEYAEHRPREGNVVVISSIPIKKDGEVLGVVSIDQDITEIRKLNYELQRARNRIQYLEYIEEEIKKLHQDFNFENIVYKSKTMYDLILLAMKVAESDASVLIQGESGTGKDLFARAIHQGSPRKDKPFIVVDCSSIPESLLESELFGYEPGAFTGAQKKGKPGKFELAEGGTVFLDEIGEMPLEMQSKLLRVLETREFYRVGGVKPVKVNIRIIAATNRDLAEMVKEGKFREDLLYRLDVVSLKIPPLRERPEDIPVLIDYYLKKNSVENKKVIDSIAPAAMEMMLNYPWPGNVRELKNVVERLVILSEDGSILAEHLPHSIRKYFESTSENDKKAGFKKLDQVVAEAEKQAITYALRMAGNNKARAAKMLGIPRSTLYFKIQTLKIDCPTY